MHDSDACGAAYVDMDDRYYKIDIKVRIYEQIKQQIHCTYNKLHMLGSKSKFG